MNNFANILLYAPSLILHKDDAGGSGVSGGTTGASDMSGADLSKAGGKLPQQAQVINTPTKNPRKIIRKKRFYTAKLDIR